MSTTMSVATKFCVFVPAKAHAGRCRAFSSASSAATNARSAAPIRLVGTPRTAVDVFMVCAEPPVAYDYEMDAMERMEKSISSCEKDLGGIRTGRASPAMLSTIEVVYYDTPTPLQSLATVSTPDAQTIAVSPFDKTTLKPISDAISNAGLGFNPSNDGKVIRINIPPLTEDRRKELAKKCASAGEEAKVAIRNVRRDVLKKAESLKLSEDAKKGMETEVQKLTDSYIKKIDTVVAKKSKEITTI